MFWFVPYISDPVWNFTYVACVPIFKTNLLKFSFLKKNDT
jgi:hypothetical protein